MKIRIINASPGFVVGKTYEATKQHCGYWVMSGTVIRSAHMNALQQRDHLSVTHR